MAKFLAKTFSISELVSIYKAGQLDKKMLKRAIIMLICIVVTYIILATIVTIIFLARDNSVHVISNAAPTNNLNQPPNNMPTPPEVVSLPETAYNGEDFDELDETAEITAPLRTNVLLLGIDNVGLADVIIVVSFDRDSGDINLLSIPRDTYTLLPPERIANMRNDGVWVPNTGILKINAVRSLGGPRFGVHYMQEQLGETLGIQFDYYVEVNLRAFREIVDLIGGVEINVPRNMFYHDPYQDLTINLQAGLQRLDGNRAEQFVRYRGYANADLGRIDAQQYFMTALFQQAMNLETVLSDPIGMARIMLQNVQTDIGLDLIRYIPYIGNLSAERIFTYTLPGNSRNLHGTSFFLPDPDLVPEVINRMFHGVMQYAQQEISVTYMSVQPDNYQPVRIAVLNGTNISETAVNVSERLTRIGFQIAYVGSYGGTFAQTQINVRDENLGIAMNRYFRNAAINITPTLSTDFDIIIIAGDNEQG
ncbi:MAG: LCP family protein [Defluviitaleaceae bacterium]|nr:LCP family protein [Defluviitaleaceae bacterium]